MSHLDDYLFKKNFMASVFGGRTYDVYSLSGMDIDYLLQDLDNELSPENLSCDGELQGKALAMKKDALENAMKELIEMQEQLV